jgi:SAM-dependent methyltransferase
MDAAMAAYRGGDRTAVLVMDTDMGGPEEVPVSVFFRSPSEMGPVEVAALERARGRVLDLGAGAGAHALPLQGRGLAVTAAELLPAGRAAMVEAGLADVREGGLETVRPDERFDTVLVLMNGLGLAETLAGLPAFLERLAEVLSPGGQILADSTDPRAWDDPGDGRYAGEVHMRLRFAGAAGPPFPFLFVDAEEVATAAASAGLETEEVTREDGGRFLVRAFRREG